MNKRVFLAVLLMISLFNTQAFAAPAVDITGMPKNTPAENVFRVKGSDQEFILLDVSDEKDSKFFVMGKGMYANRAFDSGGNQKFNPENPANIAYFLNHDFLTLGNQESLTTKRYKLPDDVVEYIDFEHVWEVEEGAKSGPAFKTKCGVALISQTELLKYKEKIGTDDDLLNKKYSMKAAGWWLRTPSVTSEVNMVRINMTSTSRWSTADAGLHIRPVFWLSQDFFKNVPIDLKTAGENVKAVFKENYTLGELKKIYSESDIYDYLGYNSKILIQNVQFSDTQKTLTRYNGGVVQVKADIMPNVTTEAILTVGVYRQNNSCKKISSEKLNLVKNNKVTGEILIDGGEIEPGDYIKVSVIDIKNPLEIVSNSIRLYQEV